MTSGAWQFFKALDTNRLLSALRRQVTKSKNPSPTVKTWSWLGSPKMPGGFRPCVLNSNATRRHYDRCTVLDSDFAKRMYEAEKIGSTLERRKLASSLVTWLFLFLERLLTTAFLQSHNLFAFLLIPIPIDRHPQIQATAPTV